MKNTRHGGSFVRISYLYNTLFYWRLVLVTLYLVFLWYFFKRRDLFQRSIRRIIRGIFYSENYDESRDDLSEKVSQLEQKIKVIKEEYDAKLLKENTAVIEERVKSFLDVRLPVLIKEKVGSLKTDEKAIFDEIDAIVRKEIKTYFEQLNLDKVSSQALHYSAMERRKAEERMLDEISMEQLRNSGRMKTVMINLFVFFNIGILMFYVFGDVSKWTQVAVYGVVGLYVSLAAFIIYIYRASNARTSVVMTIREDSKKYFDALDYLTRFKTNGELTEHDVDVIRMLSTNRSEREKAAEHPYEMIFKSVANSNIQFKGGKMSVSKEAADKKS